MSDTERLDMLEQQVTDGFYSAGVAWATIKREKLYKLKQASWGKYVQLEWGFTHGKVEALIESATVVDNLKNHFLAEELPSESQAKLLAQIPESEQPRVWGKAIASAPQQGNLSGSATPIVTDSHVLSQIRKQQKYRMGQQVEIVSGEHQGNVGTVRSQRAGVLTIDCDGVELCGVVVGEVQPTSPSPKKAPYGELVKVLKYALTMDIPEELRDRIVEIGIEP